MADYLCCSDMTWYRYRQRYPLFETRLNDARVQGTHTLVDNTLKPNDGTKNPQDVRNELVAVHFAVRARNRRDYGDNVSIDVTHTFDPSKSLEAAERRIRDVAPIMIEASDHPDDDFGSLL